MKDLSDKKIYLTVLYELLGASSFFLHGVHGMALQFSASVGDTGTAGIVMVTLLLPWKQD